MMLVALMSPIAATPVAHAWHLAEEEPLQEGAPQAPDDVWEDTDMTFVDRPVHDAQDRVTAANQDMESSYQILRNSVNDARGEATDDLQGAPLDLFRDGAGGSNAPDPLDVRARGFGDWKTIGDNAWAHSTNAAKSGNLGYTQATEPGGRYASSALSLFVSPEIDLDTNFFATNSDTMRSAATRAGRQPSEGNVLENNVPGSTLLSTIADACELAKTQYSYSNPSLGTGSFSIAPGTSCDSYSALLGDPVYSFRYALRHNLALQDSTTGLDGVTVLVFTSEPDDLTDAQGCSAAPALSNGQGTTLNIGVASQCTVATPTGGYPVSEIRSMPAYRGRATSFLDVQGYGPTYAGYSGQTEGWMSDTVNLGPWEGQSVWIGFLFASSSFPPGAYFDSTSRFDPHAGYFGFHLDELAIQAPAAPYNLKARTAIAPEFIPLLAEYQAIGIPTIPPDLPFEAHGQVVNHGSTTIEVAAALRILHQTDGSLTPAQNEDGPLEMIIPGPVTLEPGDILDIRAWFQNLTTDVDYVVQVCANRLGEGDTAGDKDFCQEPPSAGQCSLDPLDADVCDEVTLHRFNVEPVVHWDISSIQAQDHEVQVGDSTPMALTLRNEGNLGQDLEIRPRIITITGKSASDNDQRMLLRANNSDEQLTPVQVNLEPGSTTELSWDVRAVEAGQYKLMVDITSIGGGVRPFHVRDLQALFKPWRSWAVEDGITVDGIVDDVPWFENTAKEQIVRAPITYRIGNTNDGTGDQLYMLFEKVSDPQLEIFFGEPHGKAPRTSVTTGYIINSAGIYDMVYTGPAAGWVPTGSPSGTGAGKVTAQPGGNTFELRIPIGVAPAQGGITAKPGESLPFLVRTCRDPATRAVCSNHPAEAPMFDGEGIHPKDGTIEQEIATWDVLMLSALAPEIPVFERVVGGDLGVNVPRPPLLYEDFTACHDSSFFGWIPRTGDYDGMQDKWNCGPYAGDAHQAMVYQGINPDHNGPNSPCPGECGQYAMAPGYRQLLSPPFEIPAGAEKPTITIAHQYGTEILLDDNLHLIYSETLPQIWVEVWNPASGVFDQFFRLRPEGGYTTEAETGIDDPRFARQFRAPVTLVDRLESSGWWWPQGEFPLYQTPTDGLPHGGSFAGSSPWKTDVIPLYGDHFGNELALQGKIVQISLDHPFHNAPEVSDVYMNGRSNSNAEVSEAQRVATPQSGIFFASDAGERGGSGRVFVDVCRTQGVFGGSKVYLMTQDPAGCGGVAQFYDIILPGPRDVNSYLGTAQHYESVQHYDQFGASTGPGGTKPAAVPIQGKPLEPLGVGTVFDWVDANDDHSFGDGDGLFLNIGGGNQVEPRDIPLRGNVPIGETYCGTTMECRPTAMVATARDLLWVDRNFDGDWDAQTVAGISGGQVPTVTHTDVNGNHDLVFLPARVLNGDMTHVNVTQDLGWRLGGIAVTEGPEFERDITVSSASLNVSWDANELGLGPGTTVPIEVEVQNRGMLGATAVIDVFGQDVKTGQIVCESRSGNINVLDGATRNVRLECTIGSEHEFAKMAFLAIATLVGTEKDSIPGNNFQRVPGLYDVVARPDASITTSVTPVADIEGTLRQLAITVTNRGNVPLPDVRVEAGVSRMTDDGPIPIGNLRQWGLLEPLPISGSVLLTPGNSNATKTALTFTPELPGTYAVRTRLIVPGDEEPSDNFNIVEAKAQQILYRNELDGDAPIAIEGVVEGELALDETGVWHAASNSVDGSGRLAVGNLDQGEIPANTDATIQLPTIDLSAVKDATLAFKQRYDLEDRFDAARVEVSLDDGKTWSAIRPRPQPGLPDGYSTQSLIGANAILGNDFECTACAFTGDSGDLPQNTDGWITTEFDLTSQPQFLVDASITEFNLDGLAPEARATPIYRVQNDGAPEDVQWTYLDPSGQAGPPYWGIDDVGWFENHQYWWIDNRSYSEPAPQFGQTMWWSGTAGIPAPDGSLPKVGSRLQIDLAADDWPITGSEDEIVLSWWEWRAGWRTSNREGTGATFEVKGPEGSEVRIVEALPSGWTRRELLLPPGSGDASIQFTYHSGEAPGAPVLTSQYAYQQYHYIYPARWENNRGWFIDGVEVLGISAPDPRSGLRDQWRLQDLRNLDALDIPSSQTWDATVLPGHEPGIGWGLVSRGAAATESGWNITKVNLPGTGPTKAWAFSSDAYPEGYPPNADSVVVTPMVDLRNYGAEKASFRFDHKFGFEGSEIHYIRNSVDDNDESLYDVETGRFNLRLLDPVVAEAGDGGTVVYQVYDENMETYSDWIPLTGPDRLPDLTVASFPHYVPPHDRYDLSESPYGQNIERMGYMAQSLQFGSSLEQLSHMYKDGGGTNFPSKPWQVRPYAPAFTGESERLAPPGQDGWLKAEWDISHLIGSQVRFGFHVWTTPSSLCSTESSKNGYEFSYAPAFHLPRQCPGVYDTSFKDKAPGGGGGPHLWLHGVLPAPEGGWKIANIEVAGKDFQGVPADLRLRLATDGSFTKGEWSVDDISVVGSRYARNIVFNVDRPEVLAEPGTKLDLNITMENLGINERTGLAVQAVAYFDNSPAQLPVQVTGLPYANVDPALLPEGISQAVGPFGLKAGGQGHHEAPFGVSLDLPEGTWDFNLFLRVLEQPCPTCDYEIARNEEGGAAQTLVRIHVEDKLDIGFEAPRQDSDRLVLTTEPILRPGGDVTLLAKIRNEGIIEPDVTVHWTLSEIIRKGDPSKQAGLKAKESRHIANYAESQGVLPRGDARELSHTFTLPSGGLYEATIDARTASGTTFTEVLEFYVGNPQPYYRADFSQDNASDLGWRDGSPAVGSPQGGTPENLQFRQEGDAFIWGVSTNQFSQGQDYCSFGACDGNGRNSRGPPMYGLNGYADSGVYLDLGKVPSDQARLTLAHSHRFEDLDGARLEVMPLRLPVPKTGTPNPAFQCVNGANSVPLWFIPQPVDAHQFNGKILSLNGYTNPGGTPPPPDQDTPERRNPINEISTVSNTHWTGSGTRTTEEVLSLLPAFGGPSAQDEIVTYDLGGAPIPYCPLGYQPDYLILENDIPAPDSLINYTLQLRLSTGTLPGLTWQCERKGPTTNGLPDDLGRTQGADSYCLHNGPSGPGRGRLGGMGWHINAISANSVQVDVQPDRRELPILDGYSKTYSFRVTNDGTVPEVFRVEYDAQRSSPGLSESWFHFPETEVVLAGGQSKTVFFNITVPQEPAPPRGLYQASFDVFAVNDPSLRDTIKMDVDLADQPLPDLTVQLATDAPGPIVKLEQDTIATISMTVSNIGFKDSEEVPIRAELRQNGSQVPVTEMLVGSLCPAVECGDGEGTSRETLTYEWLVPHEVGTYVLRVEVDPEGRLVESSKSQNNASMLVEVVPLHRPDLSITSLEFEGLSEDGYGTEGGLLRIVANVTNLGVAPATDVDVLIFSGSAELAPVNLDIVLPGETKQVYAAHLAMRGERLVKVVVIPSPEETDPDNNELSRFLRIRGIDLNITRSDAAAQQISPGGTSSFRLSVGNDGNVVEQILVTLDETHVGWGFAASPNPVTVAPGSAGLTTITLQAPVDQGAGQQQLRILAAPQSRPDWTSTVLVPLDVATRSGAVTMTIPGNQSAEDGLAIHLKSSSNVAEHLALHLVEPTSWEIDPITVELLPHGEANALVTIRAPVTSPPGATNVTLHAVGAGGLVRAETQTIVLVDAHINATAQWEPGSWVDGHDPSWRTYRYSLSLTNNGNVAINTTLESRGLLDYSRHLSPNATMLLQPGQTSIMPVFIATRAAHIDAIQGAFRIWAEASEVPQRQLVDELSVPSLTMPDLEATHLRVTPANGLTVGEPARLFVTISNAGIVASPESELHAFVDGELVNAYSVPALEPNEEIAINMTWSFQEPGQHLIYLLSNGRQEIDEMYTDNNGVSGLVDVEQTKGQEAARKLKEVPGSSIVLLLAALAVGLLARRRRGDP